MRNATETRVEALFDVAASSALTERQKARVIAKAGPVLHAFAQDERSQWRNRELAVERLCETLRDALPSSGHASRHARASGRSSSVSRRSGVSLSASGGGAARTLDS